MYETEAKTKVDYQQLVEQYGVLVKRIAHHLLARLPESVQLDDLIQSGMIGLFEAATNYDHSKGASFETYAGIRIRGSMLDEIRKGDWIPRSVHRNSRRISDAIHTIEMREGRDATDQEVADELEVSLPEYYGLLKDTQGSRLFSFEELIENSHSDTYDTTHPDITDEAAPHSGHQNTQMNVQLVDAMKALPEREQLVLSLYYDEELNLKEIGAVLDVSESRVSQIHSQATLRLRAKMRDWA
ncbi:RNA polymerase sigma factor FliA [Reinekea thalattae]|uniref:RNA polymerase sigma factor FliA n=1 Tax=Reinekea thalattae TaxID=2593301 RepID=A0A5C8ZCM4_9GAMM|nr:RNA polymerase sigma factor FliA [Reinekea thalattae]TXR54921.1 RNA polymerase sigma factor FliA [Reinekea thalattae]